MERGGDWKHLAPLCYVRMNDGMGVYSCGPDREVWEVETLFTAITLSLFGRWRSARILLFSTSGLIFVYFFLALSASESRLLCCFVFFSPPGCCFANTFRSFINSLCVYNSPAVSSLWCLLVILPRSCLSKCYGERISQNAMSANQL